MRTVIENTASLYEESVWSEKDFDGNYGYTPEAPSCFYDFGASRAAHFSGYLLEAPDSEFVASLGLRHE